MAKARGRVGTKPAKKGSPKKASPKKASTTKVATTKAATTNVATGKGAAKATTKATTAKASTTKAATTKAATTKAATTKAATTKAATTKAATKVATTTAPKPATGAPPPRRRRATVSSLLSEAAEVANTDERAALIEAQLDHVSDPAALVRPWFDASLTLPARREITAAKALAMSRAHATDTKFLDAVGIELARRNFSNEAIDVFRMALAAGSTTDTTEMLLGYLLLSRQNAEGVPMLERSLERSPEWGLPRQTLAKWYVQRDPSRALTLLATPQDGEERELRAVALEALGQHEDAQRETDAALASFDREVEARWKLVEMHTASRNHARAFLHAHRLFELIERGEADETIDSLVGAVARAYRESGHLSELIPWVRRTETMTASVAWHIHFGLGALHPNPDPELAILAAHRMAEVMTERGDPSDARVWQVRAAGVAAKHGDPAPLEELVAGGLDDDADAWIEVGNCYMASDDYDAAGAAADRALLLDPDSGGALVMMCRLAMAMGDESMLHRCATALLEQKPTWHEGPEFLARSHARRLELEAALLHSSRAIEMAAYCHNAWTARAEALFVDGDLDGARTCIETTLAIRAGEPGDEVLFLAAALAHDRETLEREMQHRFRHLPALPFPMYTAHLRAIAEGN